MNDTCATHRSRVPRRSFGRNKRRSDDIGRGERTRPGFYFMFCVRQSSVRGCRFSFVLVYLIIKCVLNVKKKKKKKKIQAWSSLVFQCRHSSFYSFRSSSVGLETGEWRRCRSLSFTPPASLRSHGSRPRPTRHTYSLVFQLDITDINEIFRDLGMMVHEQGDMIGKIR